MSDQKQGNVHVAASSVHGRGVFATRDLPKNTTIADYTKGTKRMSSEDFRLAYPDGGARYVWQYNTETFYDAFDTRKSIAGLINRTPHKGRANARIRTSGRIVSVTKIKQGHEILVSYGRSYHIPTDTPKKKGLS